MYMGERGLGPQFQVAFSTEDNSQETVPSLGFQTWNQVLTWALPRELLIDIFSGLKGVFLLILSYSQWKHRS